MSGIFAGKVVIVTGSSAGIGQDVAVMFYKEDAAVVIHGQNADRLQQTHDLMVAKVPAGPNPDSRILQVLGSMEADDTPKKIFSATMAKFARVDVLVNNAGALQKPGCRDANSLENLDFLYRVNLRSAMELTQLCAEELAKSRGCVINVSSIASMKTFVGNINYGTVKAGLDHFTRNSAVLYGPKGVRVNSLNPGPIQTYIFERNGVTGEAREKFDRRVEETAALGQWGTPSETTECIKFLADNKAASYVTGACLVVDGGSVLYSGPRMDLNNPSSSD
jgi:NAD(P)-dependent dehydrogenase (short-subunit alcohol dehydrogenase family)